VTKSTPAQRRWWQQPLLHFVLLGLAAFALYSFAVPQQGDNKTIIVDRDTILTYMQSRARYFRPEGADSMLAALHPDELQRLIDGFDQNDNVIRRRLIQKLDFINSDLSSQIAVPTEDDIKAYFESNRDKYVSPATVTLAHVFFNQETRGWDQANVAALEVQKDLNQREAPFHEATRHGDRFYYQVNFVEASRDLVQTYLGQDVADAAFREDSREGAWLGPYDSQYGYHLITIADRVPERSLDLAEVRAAVEDDVRREAIQTVKDEVLLRVKESYDIRIEYDGSAQP
jgi:parvulin-like peptidyl-prolyl isomerase